MKGMQGKKHVCNEINQLSKSSSSVLAQTVFEILSKDSRYNQYISQIGMKKIKQKFKTYSIDSKSSLVTLEI